jgi:ferrochelatase
MKTGILIVNLGTPDSPETKDVRIFLREFLSDPLVVDLPDIPRWILVNLIIAPFRAPNSSAEYKRLWTDNGSPLKIHTKALLSQLEDYFDEHYVVEMAMRYRNPSIRSQLEKLRTQTLEKLVVVPLFPQYAEATNLSVIHEVQDQLKAMNWSVDVSFVDSFPNQPEFIQSIISAANLPDKPFEHTLFSFHGLPERQLKKLYDGCITDNCCATLGQHNKDCYRAQCYATARAIAESLSLKDEDYTVCFQSRQGRIPWIQPYTDEVIDELNAKGVKSLCVFSPAFVADCLETDVEIGHTYREQFIEGGGEEFYVAPCVNSHPEWVKALAEIIKGHMAQSV